ncbi:MAG: M24 family metallopeptidase [Candidatus Rokuibacteriota bacterium]
MNQPRAQTLMEEQQLAALVATAPENVTYTSGYWAMSQWIRRGPQAYAVHPAAGHGAPCIIAATGALDLVADQNPPVKEIHRYGYFVIEVDPGATLDARDARVRELSGTEDEGDPVAALVNVLRARGLDGARVGIDEYGIPPAYLARLREALPKTAFVPAWEVFRQIRAIKTPEEVRRLRASAQIAEKSIAAALAVARAGATEHDLAVAFHETTIREGALPVLACIGTGPRSALPNAQPTDRPLVPGDVIRFDVGGRYRHYRADIARIATLGEPSLKVKRYHHAIRAGMMRAIEAMKPGARCADIFSIAMGTARKEGMPHYKRNHVGHGIGLDGYDPPNLTPTSKEVLEEGMVLCVETPYYELGFAGLQVEDTVAVGKDGPISLMATSSELRIV